jgi:CheY-like chemotaxis protein
LSSASILINTPDNPNTSASQSEPEKQQRAATGILLVEDSPHDAYIFLELIRRSVLPIAVMVVTDGDEAIACLKREGKFADPVKYPMPSAIFLDLKMERVNGLEVLRWMKTQPQLQNMLRIILTHYQEVKDIQQAYELGAHSFLTKPLTHDELENLLLHFQPHFLGCGQTSPTALRTM